MSELAYKNGQKDIINKVEKYLLNCIEEWNELGDRKYDLPNIQVYNHIRKCLDDLEKLQKQI
jgi:hypothetical protein